MCTDPGRSPVVNGILCTGEVSCVVVPCGNIILPMGRTKPVVEDAYVVGLTDGEGCFYVQVRKASAYRVGYTVHLHFHIKMQEQDKPLLEKIRNTLGCGAVYLQKETRANHCHCYRYTVSSQKDILKTVIPFFKSNLLQTNSKTYNFRLFCEIADLVYQKAHLTQNGIEKIRNIKSLMNQKTTGLA